MPRSGWVVAVGSVMFLAVAVLFVFGIDTGLEEMSGLFRYLLMLAGGGVVVWGLVGQRGLVGASQSWPLAEGTILHSEVRSKRVAGGGHSHTKGRVYYAFIDYEYVVDNQLYLCRKICVGGELNTSNYERAAARVIPYPVGRQVKVYYYPGYPAFACLERTAEGTWLVVLIGLALGVIGYFFVGHL
jgi:hypothetical protein